MRRQSTEMRSQGTRVGSRGDARGALAKRSRLRRLAMEALEQRALLATLPTPAVSGWTTASSGFDTATTGDTSINASSPSIAVDPLDPSKLVADFTVRDIASGTPERFVIVSFSTDGGATWNEANDQPFQSGDPTSTTFKLLEDTAEGVGFDRNGNFFVGYLETNGSNAGDVAVDKYTFTGTSPAALTQQFWGNAVYSWDQALTNQNLQPSIVNFSMAVDDNVAAFADPVTGQSQGDANTGAVYLALTTDTPPPPTPPNPYDPFSIQVVASADGVTWPTPSDNPAGITGGTQVTVANHGGGFQLYTDPQIAVSQGKAGGTDGGRISVIWDDYGTGSHDGSNDDYINFAGLTFSAGRLTSSGSRRIITTTVRGAQTGTNFPLATPSSPIGIGPEAVIAVDNTLGSFSADQGRIYVAYVNRSTAAGNPADNTDVDLAFSTDDGTSWTLEGVVNDDGIVDGHTSAVDRPEFELDANQRSSGRPAAVRAVDRRRQHDRHAGHVVVRRPRRRRDLALRQLPHLQHRRRQHVLAADLRRHPEPGHRRDHERGVHGRPLLERRVGRQPLR